MPHYRCYFLGSDGHIKGVEEIYGNTDDDAVQAARHSLARRLYEDAFELWQGARRVSGEAKKPSIKNI